MKDKLTVEEFIKQLKGLEISIRNCELFNAENSEQVNWFRKGENEFKRQALQLAEQLPSECIINEVQSHDGIPYLICSECNKFWTQRADDEANFCRHCGAKIKRGKE